MPDIVARGFHPEDGRSFGLEALAVLRRVQRDIVYLVDGGYGLERSVTFVGDRFRLTARQRMALLRATCSTEDAKARRAREISGALDGAKVHVDGFNTIITLETALSGTTLIRCMDGAIRDLAGIHGTYRIIDKTDAAICLILDRLAALGASSALLYMDAPVSNSGRLAERIRVLAERHNAPVQALVVQSPDRALKGGEAVASSDSVVLNQCISWVNLCAQIIAETIPDYPLVDLSLEL